MRRSSSPLACAITMLAACGSDGATGSPDATPGDAALDGPSGPRVRWDGVLYDLDLAKPATVDDQAPLAGVEVCSVVAGEARTCVTTAADGKWSLPFPAARTGIGFAAKHAAHAPLFTVSSTLDSDELDNVQFLPRVADVAAFMTSCGASAPTATDAGAVIQGLEPVTPRYVPLDGGTMSAGVGVGPCYMQSHWVHGPNQATTTADGMGYGVFGALPVAGPVALRVEKTGATCTAARDAAPKRADGAFEVPVEPGFFTYLTVICE